jgi:hypothetical protein
MVLKGIQDQSSQRLVLKILRVMVPLLLLTKKVDHLAFILGIVNPRALTAPSLFERIKLVVT